MQFMNQIIIAMTMLMIIGGTYLFKVGMVGVLFGQFKKILWVYLFYFFITVIVGAMRVVWYC